MVNFDTPQSKAIEKLLNAYATLDLSNIEPLLSKNYHYEPVPESNGLQKQSKESHLVTWKEVFSSVNKLEFIFHEVIEAPEKVVLHFTGVFSSVFGAVFSWDTTATYTLVEEDGELKILHCKDFSDPQQRNALVAGTVKAAAERVAA